MKEQRGGKQSGHNAGPVDLQIESVELSAVMKRIEDERDQTKDVEVHGAWRVPPANKDEQPDEQIEQTDDAEVHLDSDGFVRGGGDQASFEFFAVAGKLVAQLGPETGAIQASRYIGGAWDGDIVDGDEDIARMDTGGIGGGIRGDFPGFDAIGIVGPGHAVIHQVKAGTLAEIQPSKGNRRQRRQRQYHCSYTNPQSLLHERGWDSPIPLSKVQQLPFQSLVDA
jgi:hypothetical protein